jgi:hypothetical protein
MERIRKIEERYSTDLVGLKIRVYFIDISRDFLKNMIIPLRIQWRARGSVVG